MTVQKLIKKATYFSCEIYEISENKCKTLYSGAISTIPDNISMRKVKSFMPLMDENVKPVKYGLAILVKR